MEALVSGPSRAFWAGRRVLVTGHTGFKGGWLSWWLRHLGARLSGYSLPAPTRPSLYEAAAVSQAYESEVFGDVRDAERLRLAMREAGPELVFHLAAQPLVRQSYHEPLETLSTNVMGTAHVLEAARLCDSVRAVVVVTSDKCYREQHGAHREPDTLGGHDPYSASKACAELVAASYRDAFGLTQRGLGLATVRAGNVIGGGDWTADRLVPDLLRGISALQPVALRHPQAIRPWQHVLDALAGYLMLAERLRREPQAFAEAWNFGPGHADGWPVVAIAQRLHDLANRSGWQSPAAQPATAPAEAGLHEAPALRLDSEKARARLDWRPRLDLDRALALTWSWHQAWLAGQAMREVTLQQIEGFMSPEGSP